jgi:hypothetical protein
MTYSQELTYPLKTDVTQQLMTQLSRKLDIPNHFPSSPSKLI